MRRFFMTLWLTLFLTGFSRAVETVNYTTTEGETRSRMTFVDADELRVYVENSMKTGVFSDSSDEFMSMREYFEREAGELSQEELAELGVDELIVEDPFFAAILNPEGEFQVGSEVSKVTKYYVFTVDESDIELLEEIENMYVVDAEDLGLPSTIEITVVGGNSINIEAKKRCKNKFALKNGKYRRRVKGRVSIYSNRFYGSAGVYVKNQKRKWKKTKADYLEIYVSWNIVDSQGGRYTGTNIIFSTTNKKSLAVGLAVTFPGPHGFVSATLLAKDTYKGREYIGTCSAAVQR